MSSVRGFVETCLPNQECPPLGVWLSTYLPHLDIVSIVRGWGVWPCQSACPFSGVQFNLICQRLGMESKGIFIDTEYYKKGAEIIFEAPKKEGYKFIYWDDEAHTAGTKYIVIEERIFTAEYDKENYTVTFESDGGSVVPTQNVNYNDKIVKPTDPTKIGYTFKGWYADALCTTEYDFDSFVTGNISLYAKWEENKSDAIDITGDDAKDNTNTNNSASEPTDDKTITPIKLSENMKSGVSNENMNSGVSSGSSLSNSGEQSNHNTENANNTSTTSKNDSSSNSANTKSDDTVRSDYKTGDELVYVLSIILLVLLSSIVVVFTKKKE